VNVVCELARKNPKNYLSLAPVFFKLMTTSTNNWMLIKIIKLVSGFTGVLCARLTLSLAFPWRSKFGVFTFVEPGLRHKLTRPLLDLISRYPLPFLAVTSEREFCVLVR
jgi:hypothetical protein